MRGRIVSILFRNGGDFLAFETIVGGDPNSAVLHWPPTWRPFADGDLVLIDAGAEYRGYASDITRTYPASGRFTAEQEDIYAIVQTGNVKATERCIAGIEWRDVHRTAALVIAEGLVDLGYCGTCGDVRPHDRCGRMPGRPAGISCDEARPGSLPSLTRHITSRI